MLMLQFVEIYFLSIYIVRNKICIYIKILALVVSYQLIRVPKTKGCDSTYPFLLIAALMVHFNAYTYLCSKVCLSTNRQAGPNETRYTDIVYVVAGRRLARIAFDLV
jgi:hypothetical protein